MTLSNLSWQTQSAQGQSLKFNNSKKERRKLRRLGVEQKVKSKSKRGQKDIKNQNGVRFTYSLRTGSGSLTQRQFRPFLRLALLRSPSRGDVLMSILASPD